MTKSELTRRLAVRFPQLTMPDIDIAVAVILDGMAVTLGRGRRIEIRAFGSFSLRHRLPRRGRNPLSGEKVDIPEKRALHFKTSKEMRERVLQYLKKVPAGGAHDASQTLCALAL